MKFEKIVAVRTAGANAFIDLRGYEFIIGWTEVSEVIGRGDVCQRFQYSTVLECGWYCEALVAVLLAIVEMVENSGYFGGRDTIGHADAVRAGLFDECNHSTRGVWCAAMVVGALPEASFPAFNARGQALDKRKVGFPDEGAVTEQPKIFSHCAALTQEIE